MKQNSFGESISQDENNGGFGDGVRLTNAYDGAKWASGGGDVWGEGIGWGYGNGNGDGHSDGHGWGYGMRGIFDLKRDVKIYCLFYGYGCTTGRDS